MEIAYYETGEIEKRTIAFFKCYGTLLITNLKS